jgi:hypothetical protein
MTDSTEYRSIDTALRLHYRAGPEPVAAELNAVRRQVLTRIADAKGTPVRLPGRRIMVAAAVAVIAGAAATTISLWPSDRPAPTGPIAGAGTPAISTEDTAEIAAITSADSLPATMNLLLRRVANAQPLTIAAGTYRYTAQRDRSVQSATGVDGTAHYVTEELTERWASVDQAGPPQLTRITRNLNAHPLTDADAVKLAKYGIDYKTVTTSSSDDPALDAKRDPAAVTPPPSLTNPTAAYLASLPTDVAGLKAALRTEAARDGSAANADHLIFKRVSALADAADALLSTALRSALYQVVAALPGVERVPGGTDLAGRAGVAIAETDHNGRRTEIIIDPATSRMLGSRMVLGGEFDGIPAGTVTWSSTSNQTIVNKLGDKE